MADDLTNRQKMNDLIQEMMVDQNAVTGEIGEYLRSEDGEVLFNRLRAWQERTVPGGQMDQLLSNVLTCVESLKAIAAPTLQKFVPPIVEAAQAGAIAPGGDV